MEIALEGALMPQEKLLLIPGPTPVHPRIIHSLSLPTVSHVSPVFVEETTKALANLKKIVYNRSGEGFIVSGAGTLSMEMALLNIASPQEIVLVVSQGYFGRRMADIAQSFSIPCDVLESEWGDAVPLDALKNKLSEKRYAVVYCTHVDTATGTCAPVREYAAAVRESGALFVVDGVCATGGIEENMDGWGIDVVLTAAQKCFGVPPGLAVSVFSEKAMGKRRDLGAISAYYADILRWLPIMKDPSKYFSTPCVNEIRAFYEGTNIILEEGLENRFIRHRKTAAALRSALQTLGFSFFTKDEFLADTLSVVLYPDGIDDLSFRGAYMNNGVVVAGGLGPLAGKAFRMGHMGNLSQNQAEFAVSALETTLDTLNHPFEPRAGVKAFRETIKAE